MTTIRKEGIAGRNYANIIQAQVKEYNNNGDEIKQWINDLASINRQPNECDMEKIAIKLLDILHLCASENKAIYLRLSSRSREDRATDSIARTIQFLSNSELLQTKWDEELSKYRLLPNFPNKKGNFFLCDTEISTKNGDTIYYNAYTACSHANEPCDECQLRGFKNMHARKSFIRNLFCK